MQNRLLALPSIVVTLAGCSVGEFGDMGAPDARVSPAADAAIAGARLDVTATTTPSGGPYDPAHIVAVWIEAAGGTFVKTIDRWSGVRTQHLVAWNQAAGAGDVDAVSGATRPNHQTPLSILWDLTGRDGLVVPDGTYTVRMESTDLNATTAAQNNQGTFTFVKGPSPQTQTALSSGGFVNVSLDFTP